MGRETRMKSGELDCLALNTSVSIGTANGALQTGKTGSSNILIYCRMVRYGWSNGHKARLLHLYIEAGHQQSPIHHVHRRKCGLLQR
jgi:hypothetical protein